MLRTFKIFAFVLIVISCKKRNTEIELNNSFVLDSIKFLDSSAVSYVYSNERIEYAKYYNFWLSQQHISKVYYVYNDIRITEKYRLYLPTSTIFWKQKYYYTSDGKLSGIDLYTRLTYSNGFFRQRSLTIEYNGENISYTEMKYWDERDTVNQAYKHGYNLISENGNIVRAIPAGTPSAGQEDYFYSVTNKVNPIARNNFFINEYELSNIQGEFRPEYIPLYLNKNIVDTVRNGGGLVMHLFNLSVDEKGRPTSIKLDYRQFTGQIINLKTWNLFYR